MEKNKKLSKEQEERINKEIDEVTEVIKNQTVTFLNSKDASAMTKVVSLLIFSITIDMSLEKIDKIIKEGE